jgi:hypothetical protein
MLLKTADCSLRWYATLYNIEFCMSKQNIGCCNNEGNNHHHEVQQIAGEGDSIVAWQKVAGRRSKLASSRPSYCL